MVLETGLIVTTLVLIVLYMQQLEHIRLNVVHWYVSEIWFWLRRGALILVIMGLFYSLLHVTVFKPEGYFLLACLDVYLLSQIVIIHGLVRGGTIDVHQL